MIYKKKQLSRERWVIFYDFNFYNCYVYIEGLFIWKYINFRNYYITKK